MAPVCIAGAFSMLRKKIAQYLEDPGPYNDGLDLLQAAGFPVAHLRIRGRGVRPAERRRLMDLLAEALQELPDLQPATADGTARPPEPESILRLREKGKRLLKEQSYLHAQLCTATNDDDRYRIADELMGSLVPRIDEVYNTIRRYEETGEDPGQVDRQAIVQETIEKMKKRDSLKTLIRRARRRLEKEKLTPLQRKQIEQEKALRELELEALERELGL